MFGEDAWYLRVASALHVLAVLAVALHCLRRPREPRSTLLWIFVAWSFPVIGALFYVMVGVNRVPEKAWHKQRSDRTFLAARRERESHLLAYWRSIQGALAARPADPQAAELNRVLDRVEPDHPLLGGNAIRLYVDGPEFYPPLFEALRAARHHIHIQSFIIGRDAIGQQLFDVLEARAREGVRVRVLYDAFGSAPARLAGFFRRHRHPPNLRIVGFTQVNPVRRQFQLNLRNHRKIAVIDGRIGFTGGMNLYDPHWPADGSPPIRDYHFRVEGPIVHELQYAFLRDWYYMTDDDPADLLFPAHFPHTDPMGDASVRILNGGPNAERETLCDAYFAALSAARTQVLAATPYLLPPDEIRHALRGAALRGVDVRVLVPERNNHRAVEFASHALYADLLAAGVRLFQRAPPFLHAKAMVVDERIALVGSANLDNRSLRLNYETNLAVFDAAFAAEVKRALLADFAAAGEIDLNAWRARPAWRRLVENFFNLMGPSL
jgi:cardiolipin synthase